MQNMGTYVFYDTPGHGYLEVPVSDVQKAGVESKISTCSPIYGGCYYLEEDCDAPLFMDAVGMTIADMERRDVEQAPFE